MKLFALKYICLALLAATALVTALEPQFDLIVARWFYTPGQGFLAEQMLVATVIHSIATGAVPKIMGLILLVGLTYALVRKKAARPWLFLLLALLIGPGLIANIGLKDHWGRARPRQIEAFGGTAQFTPYWQPAQECEKNCSFVAGDPAFGFMLPVLGLVLPQRRRWFRGGMLVGAVMGVNRIAMGAHFLSDVAWAALLMLATMFVLYAALYGRRAAAQAWRSI